MKPLVSIVIPVYNAEKFLSECLESVCAQTLKDIEIICVNDGSTDGSAEIVSEFASRDKRIHVITQSNAGENAARNSGIAAARGRWIGFVDSDDKVSPELYEKLISNGEKYQADISHCGLLFFYPDGREVPHYGSGLLKIQDHESGLLDLFDGRQVEPSMCCKLYRRELLTDFQPDSFVLHNGDLACNFLLFEKAGQAVYEDFCGYHYRRHENSVSADWQSVETLRGILSVRWNIYKKCSPGVIQDGAYRLWLSTLVNVLNQLSTNTEEGASEFYNELRDVLKEEKDNISLLAKKQQIAAKLHLTAPSLAALIYRVYGRYSLYRYEH